MSDIRPIYHLPEVQPGQTWCCEHGCNVYKPKLFENVYSQSWDLQGKLIDKKSEFYYTCASDHLLFLVDENDDDVILDEKHYIE